MILRILGNFVTLSWGLENPIHVIINIVLITPKSNQKAWLNYDLTRLQVLPAFECRFFQLYCLFRIMKLRSLVIFPNLILGVEFCLVKFINFLRLLMFKIIRPLIYLTSMIYALLIIILTFLKFTDQHQELKLLLELYFSNFQDRCYLFKLYLQAFLAL